MSIPIYLRKSGCDIVKTCAVAKLVHETARQVIFSSPSQLSVDADSHYYVRWKRSKGGMELWLIKFSAVAENQPPYFYIAKRMKKYRDVPADWISDEPTP